MYSPSETDGRRRSWGIVYLLVAAWGLVILLPDTRPGSFENTPLSDISSLAGWLTALCYGTAGVAAMWPKRAYAWVENTASWFGNIGLGIYLTIIAQGIFVQGNQMFVHQLILITALLYVMIGRSFFLQQSLSRARKVRAIVRQTIRDNPRSS